MTSTRCLRRHQRSRLRPFCPGGLPGSVKVEPDLAHVPRDANLQRSHWRAAAFIGGYAPTAGTQSAAGRCCYGRHGTLERAGPVERHQ